MGLQRFSGISPAEVFDEVFSETYQWHLRHHALVHFIGFRTVCGEAEFYRQLLIESFQLRARGDHRVSFFLAYAALESFINRKLDAGTRRASLQKKADELILLSFPDTDLGSHEIFERVVADFRTTLTDMRNGIAHGRLVDIGSRQSRHMLLAALLFICAIEFRATQFGQLFSAE
ncbi:hypothetical protein [Massilia sp. BSC265]|uniref:hypothetical protein n=1 Tax=Massilia sp. BSC265 TaxID=1549812 RepID=UPI0004E9385E|nr:hypothetical protein [Massilia sp. BSC265]KFI07550.1 hypothetical protein JN27_08115 [Massilia sp. BSC265]